jgi:hypothetical protein
MMVGERQDDLTRLDQIMSGLSASSRLHVRIFHCDGPPGAPWYADIDDPDDQQPDDPFWCGYFPTQPDAVEAACDLLETLSHDPAPLRLSEHLSTPTLTPVP